MTALIHFLDNHFTFHADINLDTYFFMGLMNIIFLSISRGLLKIIKTNKSAWPREALSGVSVIITMIQWWIGNHRHELDQPEVKAEDTQGKDKPAQPNKG